MYMVFLYAMPLVVLIHRSSIHLLPLLSASWSTMVMETITILHHNYRHTSHVHCYYSLLIISHKPNNSVHRLPCKYYHLMPNFHHRYICDQLCHLFTQSQKQFSLSIHILINKLTNYQYTSAKSWRVYFCWGLFLRPVRHSKVLGCPLNAIEYHWTGWWYKSCI